MNKFNKKNKILIFGFLTIIFLVMGLNFIINSGKISQINNDKEDNLNELPNNANTSPLFDFMYTSYNWTNYGACNYTWRYINGNNYSCNYNSWLGSGGWIVNNRTRLQTNGFGPIFMGNNVHTYIWILNNISLGDSILIAVDGEGDHIFNVSGETIYNSPKFGPLDIWILQDLTDPAGFYVWYEKSTGLLINGTFGYSGGALSYSLILHETNVSFSSNNNAPALTMGSVSPSTGNQTTPFNFSVIYMDQDNNQPNYVNFIINGTPYLMEKVFPFDNNYSDGCLYQFLTYLQPGFYNYFFKCSDSKFINSTSLVTGFQVSTIPNSNSPILSKGKVYPTVGYDVGTLYRFTVKYRDADNNIPAYINVTINSTTYSMSKQNPLDNNYMDGTIYEYNLYLNKIGNYTYYFNCSDGVNTDNDGPYSGPIVKDGPLFDGMYINHTFIVGNTNYLSTTSYLNYSKNIYNVTWDIAGFVGAVGTWNVNIRTRLLSNAIGTTFGNNNHTAMWIHTNLTIGDEVYLGILFSVEQRYRVIDDIFYTLPGYGAVEVLVLRSLLYPQGRVWYEKSTGILLNGTFFFNPFGGNYSYEFLSTNAEFNYLPNDYKPTLTNENFMPPIVNQTTLINFSVTYTDQDNNYPEYVRLYINGTAYKMIKQNASDNNYTDGCVYQHFKYLQPGNYDYWFECADYLFSNSTTINNIVVIDAGNFNPPILNNSQFTPKIGKNSTLFTFTVWYYEDFNNFPIYVNITINSTTYSMVQVDPMDDNAMDGLYYYFNTTLDYGYYIYQINCSDGIFTNSTGWLVGPEVNPFYGGMNKTIFEDDFEGGLSKWVSITGLWHLTNDTSPWGNSSYSPIHSMWFGRESTGTYNTSLREQGNFTSIPINLSSYSNAYLEFYHWREGEGGGWDESYVYISTNGISWDLLYTSSASFINPWQYLVFNISAYCGNDSVQIMFDFDTIDGVANDYRGWLVDDVKITTRVPVFVENLILPLNGSSIDPGWNNFSWESLDGSYSSVNYTLQISNVTDFSYLFYNIIDIQGTSNYTNTSVFLNFPPGQYYWRVRPTYKAFKGGWSDYNEFSLTQQTPPILSLDSVSPKIGRGGTLFNFTVVYTDLDNDAPVYVNVMINGTSYTMVKQNPADLDYTDGCLYHFNTTLPIAKYNYTYYFNCSDGFFSNLTVIRNDLYVWAYAPVLSMDLVSPKLGNES
ncbi:MAG: hypothetical protein ACTSQJ_05570, partial [Promethearchaeota archaeon]